MTPNERRETLVWLARELNNGRYISYSSSKSVDFNQATAQPSLFITSIISQILSQLEAFPEHDSVQTKIYDVLLKEQSIHGSWNYWERESNRPAHQDYPDDLDDTFHAFSALASDYTIQLPGEQLAHIAKLLSQQEKQPGGPYRTWCVPSHAPPQWQDIDPIVNAAIARFLLRFNIHLPPLITYLTHALDSHAFTSPYYPSPLFGYYILSDIPQTPFAQQIRAFITAYHPENPLEIAMTVCIYNNLKLAAPSEHHQKLYESYNDTHWSAYGFCYDPVINGITHYAGAEALTTAFALLATKQPSAIKKEIIHSEPETHVYAIGQELASAPSPLGCPLQKQYEDWQNRNFLPTITNPITVTARYLGQTVTARPVQYALRAQIYGWLAFTLLDSIWDGDRNTNALPSALYALRHCHLFLSKLSTSPTFIQTCNRTFLRMEQAVGEEIARRARCTKEIITLTPVHFSLDANYSADQSAGHLLAVEGLLRNAGCSTTVVRRINTLLTLSLAARQLNDDLHDWETDLRRGHITPVISQLLRDSKFTPGDQPIASCITKLQPLLWRSTIKHFLRQLTKLHAQADKTLHQLLQAKPEAIHFAPYVNDMAQTRSRIVNKYTQAQEFLAHYRPKE